MIPTNRGLQAPGRRCASSCRAPRARNAAALPLPLLRVGRARCRVRVPATQERHAAAAAQQQEKQEQRPSARPPPLARPPSPRSAASDADADGVADWLRAVPTVEELVGGTPLVRLRRLPSVIPGAPVVLAKLGAFYLAVGEGVCVDG